MDCCATSNENDVKNNICPKCGETGKSVQLITLKSLLKPQVLETLQPNSFHFCPNESCTTAYFSATQVFDAAQLKVPVYQKDNSVDVPVCYCFDWTRERLSTAVNENVNPAEQIKKHVQDGRCGCEVNNPQGSCCLGNVASFMKSLG